MRYAWHFYKFGRSWKSKPERQIKRAGTEHSWSVFYAHIVWGYVLEAERKQNKKQPQSVSFMGTYHTFNLFFPVISLQPAAPKFKTSKNHLLV